MLYCVIQGGGGQKFPIFALYNMGTIPNRYNIFYLFP